MRQSAQNKRRIHNIDKSLEGRKKRLAEERPLPHLGLERDFAPVLVVKAEVPLPDGAEHLLLIRVVERGEACQQQIEYDPDAPHVHRLSRASEENGTNKKISNVMI